MIRSAMLFAVLALAIPLHAQENPLPEAPKPKADRIWLIESATLGGLYATDFTLTAHGRSTGGCQIINETYWNCSQQPRVEHNPLLGRQPSNAKLIGYAAGLWSAEALVLRYTEHSRHAWVRWAGRTGWAYFVVDEARSIRSWK